MTDGLRVNPREDVLSEQQRLKETLHLLLMEAQQKGASSAEAAASFDVGFGVTVRQGEVETVEHHRDKGLSLTVYFGQRKGSASSSDTRQETIHEVVNAACDIAKYTSEDPFAGLADKALMAFDYPDLDLYHPWTLQPDQAIELAKACEARGFAFDKRISNSEGASVTSHQGVSIYANTHGFVGVVPSTRHSITCILIAREADAMQRDYYYTVARDPNDLEAIEKIGDEAALRTIRRLGARTLPTGRSPVIFAPEVARGLLGHFMGAIRGGNLYRKSSFLLDHLGKKVFPHHVQMLEQPHLTKGLGSAPFDSEGVITREHALVKDGILESYILDSYSARKLGMQTTGNSGGIHNVTVAHSDLDLDGLIKHMHKGLLVTELLGQGVNIVTGDYSRGACGFWVEEGQVQFPVEEITIAGNLKDIYANLVLFGNDIDKRGGIQTGSILLEEMMIAGH